MTAVVAADTDRFGFKMLEKMGWSEGNGLGAKGNGMTRHVKVARKANALGEFGETRVVVVVVVVVVNG